MSSKNRTTIRLWLETTWNWLSSGFLSAVILAACIIPVAWALDLNVSDFRSNSLDVAQACELAVYLSAAIGISTFLSGYILLGHPAAYAGPLIVIFPILFGPRPILLLATVPVVIGGIAAHYLNRYTRHRAKRTRCTPNSFVSLRIACVCSVALPTLALLGEQYHWPAYLIWLAQLALYLSGSFRNIWHRAVAQIAV